MNKLLCLLIFMLPLFAFGQSNELNAEVLKFVDQNIGKKVDRGECWDLAAKALDKNGAKWDHEFKFGRLLDLKKDTVKAGDIIQFKNVIVAYTKNGTEFREKMLQHTAVIYKVRSPKSFVIADQNTARSGRKVGTGDLDLNDIIKGQYWIYRPIK